MTTQGRRTQLERRDLAERALLGAAVRLFARKGMDGTSLADIGAEAGYSRNLVNHHFGTRGELVARLAEQAGAALVAALPAGPVDLDAMAAFADSLLDRVVTLTEELRAFYVMWGASIAQDAPLREIFAAHDTRFRTSVEKLVRRGQAAGSLRSDVDPTGFSIALVALIRGVCVQFLVDVDGVDIGAARTACVQLVRTALAPVERHKEARR